MAIYPKQLRFLLGSSLQQTSAPPCGALDRFRKFGLGRLAIKRVFFTFHVFDIFIVMLMYYLLSFCVVCRYVLFVLRFVYTGEFISVGSNCNFVVV